LIDIIWYVGSVGSTIVESDEQVLVDDGHMALLYVGSVGSTIVESDEQVLVDDGHMALYEVCCYHFVFWPTDWHPNPHSIL